MPSGDYFEDLADLTGAPSDGTYPWLADPSLSNGVRRLHPLMSGGTPVPGTCSRIVILGGDGSDPTYWETNPIAEAQRLPDLVVLKRMQSGLKLLDWVKGGLYQNESYFVIGTASTKIRQRVGPFDIVSASGKTLVLDSMSTDIRHFTADGWEGTISMFDEVEFEYSIAGEQLLGMVKSIDLTGYSAAGDNFTVELFHTVDNADTVYDPLSTGNPARVYFRYHYLPETWQPLEEFHPLWCYKDTKSWTYDEANDESTPFLLPLKRYSDDDSHGKIAYPRADTIVDDVLFKGTVKVELTDSAGDVTDITSANLSKFQRTQNSSSPFANESYFDATGLVASGESIRVYYMIERTGSTSVKQTFVPCQDRCKFARMSADGNRAYCGKGRTGSGPSKLSRFKEGCYQSDCDGFEDHEPFSWEELGAVFDQMLLSYPLLLDQTQLPPSEKWEVRRFGTPSVGSLLGLDLAPDQITGINKKSYIGSLYPQSDHGAFFPNASVGAIDYDGSWAASDVQGIVSGSSWKDFEGDAWDNTSDPDYGARCLLNTDRVGCIPLNQENETFGGRTINRRARQVTYTTAATNVDHANPDPTSGDNYQVAWSHGGETADIVLTVAPLESHSEATIRNGTVGSISDEGSGVILIEPENVTTAISWYDTATMIANSGTIEVGAAGYLGFVLCHPAWMLRDHALENLTVGRRFAGCIPGDFVRFTGLTGFDDADEIMARGFLVTKTDPFGGTRQDPTYNGSPGNPPSYWQPPTGFGDGTTGYGFERCRVWLEDQDDLLADNTANLAAASMKAVAGGVMRSLTSLDNNGDAIDLADITVNPYTGSITIPWGTTNSGSDGYYRVVCEAIQRTCIVQGAALEEIKDAIEYIDALPVQVTISGTPLTPYRTARCNYQDDFGNPINGFSLWQDSDVDSINASTIGPAPNYLEFGYTGNGYSSGGGSYALCPTGAQEPIVVNAAADNIRLDSGFNLGIPGGIAKSSSGALVTDYLSAHRRYRRVNESSNTSTPFTPGFPLSTVFSGTEITSATIDVTFGNIRYASWKQRKHGHSGSSPGETVDAVHNAVYYRWPGESDTVSSAPNIILELYGITPDNTVELIHGSLATTYENSTTKTLDITEVVQAYLDNVRGKKNYKELFFMPAILLGSLTEFESFWIPDRTGTKYPEYTGCSGGSTVAQSTATLDLNDYTDEAHQCLWDTVTVGNFQVTKRDPTDVQDLRIPYNPATGKYRDLVNP